MVKHRNTIVTNTTTLNSACTNQARGKRKRIDDDAIGEELSIIGAPFQRSRKDMWSCIPPWCCSLETGWKVGCQRPACLTLWRIRSNKTRTVELPDGTMTEMELRGYDRCPHPDCGPQLNGSYRLCGIDGNRNGKRRGYLPNCWIHEDVTVRNGKPFRRLQEHIKRHHRDNTHTACKYAEQNATQNGHDTYLSTATVRGPTEPESYPESDDDSISVWAAVKAVSASNTETVESDQLDREGGGSMQIQDNTNQNNANTKYWRRSATVQTAPPTSIDSAKPKKKQTRDKSVSNITKVEHTWQDIQSLAESNQSLSLTVPIPLPSGTDPYTIDHHSTAELKQELKVAITKQLAAYMRLLHHKEQYKTEAFIPFDHLDELQYPLTPRRFKYKRDKCGYAINRKHFLYDRYCSQIGRSLTTKSSNSYRYALRDVPIVGDWFQFEFIGPAFNDHRSEPAHKNAALSLIEVAFLAYCTSWELKGRPVVEEESHDRMDNNKGYTMANTRSRTITQQNWNRESMAARMKYRVQIQDGGSNTRNYTDPKSHSHSFTDSIGISKLNHKANKAERLKRIKQLAQTKNETLSRCA